MNSNSYNYSSERSLCSVTDLIMTVKTSPVICLANYNLSSEENKISWQFYGACTGSGRSVVVLRFIRVFNQLRFTITITYSQRLVLCAVRSKTSLHLDYTSEFTSIRVFFERRSQGWPRWPQPPQSPLRKNYKAKQLIICTTIGCSVQCSDVQWPWMSYDSTNPPIRH